MIAAIDARHQRTEFAVGGFPPAQHDLVSGAALGLGPVLGPARAIGRAELLRDDAFQRQLAGRLQNCVAAGFEMLDIADQAGFALGPRFQQFFQLRLSLGERQAAYIHSIGEQQIEREENEIVGLAVGKCGLQRGKIRRAVMVERDDLAVNKHIGKRASLVRNRLKLFGPVQAFSGLQRGLAVLDPQLHPVAVEFDLVAPSLPVRGTIDRRAELRRYEIRDRRDFLAFCRWG